MIDCHCHLLPGIDDGARDMPYALEMAKVAVQSGTTEMILTPHHNDGMYFNILDDVIEGVERFQLALDAEKIPLKLHPGSELHVVPELPEQVTNGIACTYANKNKAALLELPKNSLPLGAEQIIEQIAYLGITPIIAHPERNSVLCHKPEIMKMWFERGWKFQLTNQSISGQFGQVIQDACYFWLSQGWIHLIASDAHRSQGRSPDMRKGVEQLRSWFGSEVALLLSDCNPRQLIEGIEMTDMPIINQGSERKEKKWFAMWKK